MSRLATAGYDNTVRIWEAATAAHLRTIQYTESPVNKLAFSPDARSIAVAGNPKVMVFDVPSYVTSPSYTFAEHSANVTALGFQADSQWCFSASEDSTLKIWDLRAPRAQRTFRNGTPLNDAILHPNKWHLVSADHNGALRVWDVVAGRFMGELSPQGTHSVSTLALSTDGSILVAANKLGTVYVWRVDTALYPPPFTFNLNPSIRINVHNRYVPRLALSPDNNTLAVAQDSGELRLLDFAQEEATALNNMVPSSTHAESHTQSALLPGTGPTTASLANPNRRTWRVSPKGFWVWDAVFSPDGAYLYTASADKRALSWNVATGGVDREYSGHQKGITSLALSCEDR